MTGTLERLQISEFGFQIDFRLISNLKSELNHLKSQDPR
jgi:hypothetical protein